MKATALMPLRPLHDAPPDAIETVLDAAFGPGRFGRTAYAIRQGMAWLPALSFALEDGAQLIGTIQCWPVALIGGAGEAAPLIMVGPVAVVPARQGEGHGRALMDAAMAAARDQADAPLMMIGDPEYYGRFWGFSAEPTAHWRTPGPVEPRRLLARSVRGLPLPIRGMLGPRP